MTLAQRLIGDKLSTLVRNVPNAKLIAIKEISDKGDLPKALDELKKTQVKRDGCIVVIIDY
jgi:hypothetical protein